MAVTTYLGITLLEAAQAEKTTTINNGIITLDAVAGAGLGFSAPTGTTYTILNTDYSIFVTHTAATVHTLPATTGASAPRVGQRFVIRDASVAGAGTFNITIGVPSGKKLDGVTNGTIVIAGDRGWIEVMFVSDSLGYYVVRGKGVLTANELMIRLGHIYGLVSTNGGTALPTSGNQAPAYLPFYFAEDVLLTQIGIPMSAVPATDGTDARLQIWFQESLSTWLPGATRFGGAVEAFKLRGTGHIRSTAGGWGAGTSFHVATGVCALATPRYFKGNTIYWLGLHWEPTFDGTAAVLSFGRGSGLQTKRLSTTQAYPFTPTSSPTVTVVGGSEQILYCDPILVYKRIADIS